MSLTAPVVSTASDDAILATVCELVTTPWPGWSEWEVTRSCATQRVDIERRLSGRRDGTYYSVKVGLANLRKMAKAGKLVEITEPGSHGRFARFTTPEVWTAVAAERALSEGERAERTAAALRERYERNRAERPDYVSLHPVDTSHGGVPHDGLAAAVEGGLIRIVHTRGSKASYVPEDMADAWQQAYDDELARQEARDRHIDGRRTRLLALCPPTGQTRRVVELDLGQVDAIIAALDLLPDCDLTCTTRPCRHQLAGAS